MSATATPPPALALAVASLGVGLFASRYLYFPVPMPGSWDSVMTGGGIGLLVASRGLWRARGDRTLTVPVGALALVVPALLALGLLPFLAPERVSADVDLIPFTLPGLQIDLPGWEAQQSGTDPMFGAVELAEPGGNGRFIKVQWASGPVPTLDERESQFGALFRQQLIRRDAVEIAGRPSATLRFQGDGGKRVLVTSWACPDQGMFGAVMGFVSLDWDEAARLHQRIIGSASCLPVDRSQTPVRTFATFTAPPGFAGPDGDEVRSYEGDAGVILSYPAMDHKLEVALAAQPAMRQELLRTALQEDVVEVDAAPFDLPGAVGTTRKGWRGQVTSSDGSMVHAVMATVTCPATGQGFLLFYLSEVEAVPDDVAVALVGASCP
jgi:hypothetical protein